MMCTLVKSLLCKITGLKWPCSDRKWVTLISHTWPGCKLLKPHRLILAVGPKVPAEFQTITSKSCKVVAGQSSPGAGTMTQGPVWRDWPPLPTGPQVPPTQSSQFCAEKKSDWRSPPGSRSCQCGKGPLLVIVLGALKVYKGCARLPVQHCSFYKHYGTY